MAHLWMKHDNDELAVLPLSGDPVAMTESQPRRCDDPDGVARDGAVILERMPAAAGLSDAWYLFGGEGGGLRVNGMSRQLGLHLLADGDVISVRGAGSFVFSTETLPRIEPMPAGDAPVYCGRCKQAIVPGVSAVCCPGCGLWHHQLETAPVTEGEAAADGNGAAPLDELPCWTYDDRCAMCGQPTDLSGGFQRIPEDM